MKIISIIIIGFILAGGSFSSCKHPTAPTPDTTKKKCDTCCDTCHKLCDTCNKPCDTCNLNKDSLAHAFTWTEHIGQIAGEASMTGVWVFGQSDIYIVGNSLWHFDGTSFRLVPAIRTASNTTLNGALNGFKIFAFSKSDFWLVYGGGGGNIAFHTVDGTNFDDNRPGLINACWGTKSSDMFFVGNSGTIFHYDGTNFTAMTSNTSEDLQSVWGTSSTDVWASGFNYSTGGTVIEHYDGNSWTVDNLGNSPLGKLSGLDAVWTCDSSNHKFVAASGAFVLRKTDNGSWRIDSTLMPLNSLGKDAYVGLELLRGNSATDIMAVGSWGWVGHWNGKTWKKYDQLYDYNNGDYIPHALSLNGNTACVVGTKGGASWVAIGQRK